MEACRSGRWNHVGGVVLGAVAGAVVAERLVGGWRSRRRSLEVVDRAIARGELPADLHREAALDLTVSCLYWRVVVRRSTLEPADLDHLVATVTAGRKAL